VLPPSDKHRVREVESSEEAVNLIGMNSITDVWRVKKVSSQETVHLTEKPVELGVRALKYSTLPGENVLELFGGSGSTLIACEMMGRRCFAMEIDRWYTDVIVQRWLEFTGKEAIRYDSQGNKTSWASLTQETGADRRQSKASNIQNM
ncbi:MAG: hypothetical protein FWH27_16290, partial [Planctomycetaceae bacterium]|nr:hypothetical protein [Planctomycetaceae bacterium]